MVYKKKKIKINSNVYKSTQFNKLKHRLKLLQKKKSIQNFNKKVRFSNKITYF